MTLAVIRAGNRRTVRFTIDDTVSLEGSTITTTLTAPGEDPDVIDHDPTYSDAGRHLVVDVPVVFEDEDSGRWKVTCDVDTPSGASIVRYTQSVEVFPE